MRKIAIVDDEPLMLEGFCHAFDWEKHGYAVIGAFRDAGNLLEFCREHSPDLIILDVNLPHESGLSVLKRLKQHFPRMLVVMLTAHNEFEYVRESLRCRADEYLWKPELSFDDILRAMDRVFDGHAAQGAKEEAPSSAPEGFAPLEKQLNQYIVDNLQNENLSLKDVAGAVHLSYSYLSRIFSGLLGDNFTRYLAKRRVEAACALLRREDICMARVMEQVGYTDQSYFIKAFKQIMGVTPVQYRQQKHMEAAL